MPVGAWGYGTGATSVAAHPFSLTIQGIDVIASVPMESISVSASVSSNATLSFTIWDDDATVTIPGEWADVVFTDHTEGEVIFGGVVMGVEVKAAPIGRWLAVRCVDYGILLDVTPMVTAAAVAGSWGLGTALRHVAALAPLGGITTSDTGLLANGHGPEDWRYISDSSTGTDAIDVGSSARYGIDWVASRIRKLATVYDLGTDAAVVVYVNPLRQLVAHPGDEHIYTAPLTVRQNASGALSVAAAEASVDYDYRTLESGVRVSDSDTTTGGDNSGFYYGTTNGYTVMPGSVSVEMSSAGQVQEFGERYMAGHRGATAAGRVVVTSTKNFFLSQSLTVYYPGVGLDDDFPIHAVSVQFLGGLQRRTTIDFPVTTATPTGERGTVSRWNRKRFARAGVYT